MAKTLVLIPGLLCNHHVFATQTARLQSLYNVIVLQDTLYAHNDMKKMAESALKSLPSSFAVAGFSMGGYLALEMAHQAPSRISHLALISSQAKPDSQQTSQRRRLQIETSRAGNSLLPIIKQQLPMLLSRKSIPADAAQRVDSAHAKAHHAERIAHLASYADASKYSAFNTVVDMACSASVDGFENQQLAIMSRKDHTKTLEHQASLGTPILIASGREDQLIPYKVHHDLAELCKSASGQFSARNDDASAHAAAVHHADRHAHHHHIKRHERVISFVHPDAGHMLPAEAPDQLTAAMSDWMLLKSGV